MVRHERAELDEFGVIGTVRKDDEERDDLAETASGSRECGFDIRPRLADLVSEAADMDMVG